MAEFNGHTHKDEFKIFYEKNNNSNPLSVAWNGGSLTPYSYVNPNYRIFEVDSNTLVKIIYEIFKLNRLIQFAIFFTTGNHRLRYVVLRFG